MNTTLAAIENINIQIDAISKKLKYGWDSDDVKILLSITGIDVFAAMLIATEIVDVKRFCTPWKLVSYAGLAPSTRESSGGLGFCQAIWKNVIMAKGDLQSVYIITQNVNRMSNILYFRYVCLRFPL
jgi:transposase